MNLSSFKINQVDSPPDLYNSVMSSEICLENMLENNDFVIMEDAAK